MDSSGWAKVFGPILTGDNIKAKNMGSVSYLIGSILKDKKDHESVSSYTYHSWSFGFQAM